MPDGIFHKRLQHHYRNIGNRWNSPGICADGVFNVLFKVKVLYLQVTVQDVYLRLQRDQVRHVAFQRFSDQLRELNEVGIGMVILIFQNEILQRVQRVKDKVGVHQRPVHLQVGGQLLVDQLQLLPLFFQYHAKIVFHNKIKDAQAKNTKRRQEQALNDDLVF